MDYDVVIIGGGSAGYAAARTAREGQAEVAIVDHGPLGGLCILKGCMPTKTILRSSDLMALQQRAQEFGLLPVQAKADLSAINDRKNRIIGEFTKYRVEQLQDPGFTLYEDKASFLSPNEVQVGTQTLRAKNFIIATGSKITEFPVPGLKEAGCLTSDDVLEMRAAPESLIVLGAGPVAVELAQFFARIGVKVSLIQRSHQILSGGDEDLARVVEARLREEGMDVYTGTRLLGVTKEGNDRVVKFLHESHEKTVRARHILQALGRRQMRTNQPNIFAVGDVNGLHEIVHIAIEQGEIAAHNAVFPEQPARTMDDRLKASVVFTDPAVASVGLSEKECLAGDIAYLVASYPFNDHGKSICMGETHGHVKILCHPKTGAVIGAHIVGPEAGELIHELITVMYFNGTVHDLVKIPHYHPTLSEIITYPAEELIEKLA